jgi:tRNA-Thr(GGU) m(6)t(6)A37 methyltransferase TsaA
MKLVPVGFVRNVVKSRHDMPAQGVPAKIKILPKYRPALEGLKNCSHIWVLCCFDKADRSVLRATPRKASSFTGEKGVFATRSPDRPNPVSLTCARLLSVRGGALEVAELDAADSTPVADIKPYSPGMDCVPCASKPDFSAKYRLSEDKFIARTFARIVGNFCGKLDAGGMRAAALALKYARLTGAAPESGADEITTNLDDSGIDALYALFSLKPSSGAVRRVKFPKPAMIVKHAGQKNKIVLGPEDIRRFKACFATDSTG